jgi:Fe-S-cluster containining protein
VSGEDLDRLGRQVERGSLFTHTALGRGFVRLRELESFVYGLIDALIARNVVTQDEIADAVASVRRQLDASGEIPEPGVALRVDNTDPASPPVVVDCNARMHVCHAVCCKLEVVLSADEVEEGKAKWDLGRPYLLRHESDGLCTHNDRGTGRCGIYGDRPLPCRRYTCANDERIWKDFEKMELNHEWLAENLSESRPRLRHAMLATPSVEPDG